MTMTVIRTLALLLTLFGTIVAAYEPGENYLEACGGDKTMALLKIAREGGADSLNIVAYLLQESADVNVWSRDFGGAPLFLAVARNDLGMTRAFIKAGASVDTLSTTKRTALNVAAEHGYDNIAVLLLAMQANPNLPNSEGKTAFHYAAERGDEGLVYQILVNPKPGAHLKTPNGDTPLQLAVKNCHHHTADLLLRSNPSSIYNQDKFFSSPLHSAVYRCDHRMVRILLQFPQADLKDNDGDTALQLAVMKCQYDNVKAMLESRMFNVNNQNNGGHTPLHEAVIHCQDSMVRLLVDNRANVEIKRNNDGRRPYDQAIYRGYESMVEIMRPELKEKEWFSYPCSRARDNIRRQCYDDGTYDTFNCGVHHHCYCSSEHHFQRYCNELGRDYYWGIRQRG